MAAVDISDGSSAAATPASNPSPPPDSLPPLELVSLDLQPSWAPYVKALQTPRSLASYSFHQWDIKAEVDAVTASGLECLDLCIISNVLVYCTDERTADVLSDLLINRKVCAHHSLIKTGERDPALFALLSHPPNPLCPPYPPFLRTLCRCTASLSTREAASRRWWRWSRSGASSSHG